MRNRWNVEKDSVIGWLATLDGDVLGDVVRLGEETGAYRVVTAPALGFDRSVESRSYSEYLSGRPVDPAALSGVGSAASRIAYVNPSGLVVEDDVVELGALLPESPGRRPRAPLELMALRPPPTARLSITSCSDIWLPWCSAWHEDGAHRDDLADNRELAGRHAPRLNAFLTRIAELGDVELDPESTTPRLGFQVTGRGVRLDVENPRERTVWERFGDPGWPDLLEAARRAVRRAEQHPESAPYRSAVGLITDAIDHPLFRADHDVAREILRAAAVGSVLDGSMRVKVLAGEVQHVFEPEEIAP
ncbi:hypothetical protein [Actinomycetospora sp. CA-084318]|uniref:hypothetical protein n=1 Tax=Actinomycetospora sp. CA-084318 TaxID=3239892 RepID=UPI003D95ABC5